jgi:hypothetical protein
VSEAVQEYEYRYERGNAYVVLAAALAAIGLLTLGFPAAAVSAMPERGVSGVLVGITVAFTGFAAVMFAVAWRFYRVNAAFRRDRTWCGIRIEDETLTWTSFDGFKVTEQSVGLAGITGAQQRFTRGGEVLRLVAESTVALVPMRRLAAADRLAVFERFGVRQ